MPDWQWPRAASRHTRAAHLTIALGLSMILAKAPRVQAYPLDLHANLGASEEYNDNVFFDESDEKDLITNLTLGLGFSYRLPAATIALSAATSARFFALGTQDNTVNLGDNQFVTLGTSFQATPRLSFSVSDSIARVSETRGLTISPADDPTGGSSATDPTGPGDTGSDPGTVPGPSDPSVPSGGGSTSVGDFLLPRGNVLSNALTLGTRYLLTPLWSTHAFYTNRLSDFSDPNDTDIWHRVSAGVGYQWSPRLSLSATYLYSRFNLDSGLDAETHGANLGTGYALSPTWNVALSGGVFFNHPLESQSAAQGPTINNVSNRTGFSGFLTTTKAFDLSSLSLGVGQGVTPSAGVAGLSVTQNAYVRYTRQLLQWLTGSFSTNFNNYQTDINEFRTLYVLTGFAFPIWKDIYGGFYYSYRWRDADESSQTLAAGTVDGNVIAFRVSTSIPIWQTDLELPF